MYKYLFFIILGILLFIFLNNYNTFSIGIPYQDNSIYTLPLESTTKEKYKYCLLSMEDLDDVHYIICIIHLDDDIHFESYEEHSDLIKVYTLGYGGTLTYEGLKGGYSSPNGYSVNLNKPLVNVDTLNQFNDLLFIPWDSLDNIMRRNAIILGWKKSMWDIVFVKTMSVYISYYYEKYSEPDDDLIFRNCKILYIKLLLLNSSLNDENLFNLNWDYKNVEQSRAEIHKLMGLNLSNPDTFPTDSYEKYNPDKPNTFNLNWDELSVEQIQAARIFGLNSGNWNINKWFINLKSQYFLPNLSKYRKVIDWSDLTHTQFTFLKFLKSNMSSYTGSVKSMNFCPYNPFIRGEMIVTLEDFRDTSSAGFFSEKCTTDGCCLDGAVSFLNDETLEMMMVYMIGKNKCSV